MFALCVVVIAATVQSVESSCGKSSVDVSDVIVACPLNMDVNKTRHSIVIARFVNRIRKETVLSCVWNGKLCPHCVSFNGWELVGDLTRQVLARVPVSKLHNDSSYTSQEVPPESEDPHNDCQLITISQQGPGTDDLLTTDFAETPTTTDKTDPSTAADEANTSTSQTTDKLKPSTPHNRDVQTSAENQGESNRDLLCLAITTICLQLLLLILAVLILILLYKRYMIEKPRRSPGDFQNTVSCRPMSSEEGMDKIVMRSPSSSNGRCDLGEGCADVGDAPVDVTSDKGEADNMGVTLAGHATLDKCPETRELLHKEQLLI